MSLVRWLFSISCAVLFVSDGLLAFARTTTTVATGDDDKIPFYTTLRDGQRFPLLGLGVGNLQHELIVQQIEHAVGEYGVRLIDTAHASRNEQLVRQGIRNSAAVLSADGKEEDEVHVITKIWYTYLGYNRTMIAVREALQELSLSSSPSSTSSSSRLKGGSSPSSASSSNNSKHQEANLVVHILLHWPRCRDDIEWMDCEQEERNLPQEVKDAGKAPHLDKDHAFKESWRALEDVYEEQKAHLLRREHNNLPKVGSIGVSNFDLHDLQDLATVSKITPHILQDNVWNWVFQPDLIKYVTEHGIHYQCYNVMNGILGQQRRAPLAYDSIELIAEDLSSSASSSSDDDDDVTFTAAQVLLKWLVQNGVSAIPRTSQTKRVEENSPHAVQLLPDLDSTQQSQVRDAVKALLRGQDLVPPHAIFVNRHKHAVELFWSDTEEDGNEIFVGKLEPGESFHQETYQGHIFVAYSTSSEKTRKEFQVQAGYGQEEKIHIGEDEL